MAPRNTITTLWLALHEPRIITLIMMVSYATMLALGIYQTVEAPRPHDDQLDALTRYLVAGSFTIGGAIGLAATPRGIWHAERAAITFLATGFGVHLWWTLTDPRPGVRWVQVAYLFFCLLMLAKRGATLFTSPRLDPTKR